MIAMFAMTTITHSFTTQVRFFFGGGGGGGGGPSDSVPNSCLTSPLTFPKYILDTPQEKKPKINRREKSSDAKTKDLR